MNTLLALVFLFGPAPEPKGTPKEVYKAVTDIDTDAFEVPIIYGEYRKPTSLVITVRKQGDFEAMIPERSDFKSELAKSLEKLDDSSP